MKKAYRLKRQKRNTKLQSFYLLDMFPSDINIQQCTLRIDPFNTAFNKRGANIFLLGMLVTFQLSINWVLLWWFALWVIMSGFWMGITYTVENFVHIAHCSGKPIFFPVPILTNFWPFFAPSVFFVKTQRIRSKPSNFTNFLFIIK